jgi:hypothetical protein
MKIRKKPVSNVKLSRKAAKRALIAILNKHGPYKKGSRRYLSEIWMMDNFLRELFGDNETITVGQLLYEAYIYNITERE